MDEIPTDLAQALIKRACAVGVTPGELIAAIIRADLNDEPFDPDQIRKDRTRQLFFLVPAARQLE